MVKGLVKVRKKAEPKSPNRPEGESAEAMSVGWARNILLPIWSKNKPPHKRSKKLCSNSRADTAVMPNAAINPYSESATAVPNPETMP